MYKEKIKENINATKNWTPNKKRVKLILILFDVSEKDLESCLSSSIDNIIGLCLAPLLDK